MIKQFEGTDHDVHDYFSERKEDKLTISAIWVDGTHDQKDNISIKRENTMMDLWKVIADAYKIKPCYVYVLTMKGGEQMPMAHIELWSRISAYKQIKEAYLKLRPYNEK